MNIIIQDLLISIIKFYKFFISPLLGSRCRFLPTCSEYFIEALKMYGITKGSKLGFKRIFKCHPFKKLGGDHGLDFVPVSSNAFRKIKIKKGVVNKNGQ